MENRVDIYPSKLVLLIVFASAVPSLWVMKIKVYSPSGYLT